jgi:hypothetical protein
LPIESFRHGGAAYGGASEVKLMPIKLKVIIAADIPGLGKKELP